MLSASKVRMLEECPAKYDYHSRGLRPFVEPIILDLGRMIHAMLESVSQTGQYDLAPIWDFYEAAISESKRQKIARYIMLATSIPIWQDWFHDTCPDWQISMSEHSFDHVGYMRLRGRIDAIYKTPEGLMLVDYKTTSLRPSSAAYNMTFGEGTPLNLQARTYCEATNIWNFTWMTLGLVSIRQKKNEVTNDFISRGVSMYKEHPDMFFAIHQHKIPKTASVCEDYSRAGRLIALYRQIGFPKHTGSCARYNSVCPFLGLCLGRDSEELYRELT